MVRQMQQKGRKEKMKEYRLAIFDLDGTILDTLDDLTAAMNYALTCFSFPIKSRQEIRGFLGNGMKKLTESCLPGAVPPELQDKVLQCFSAYYHVHCTDKTAAYPGISDLLRNLRRHGIPREPTPHALEQSILHLG